MKKFAVTFTFADLTKKTFVIEAPYQDAAADMVMLKLWPMPNWVMTVTTEVRE